MTLYSQILGGIHEGFAPEKKPYPLLVYSMVSDVYGFTWGALEHHALFDIRVISRGSVEANNLDALVLTTLNDAALSVTGQSTLLCRRVADLSDQDEDDEGRKVYVVGGTYEVWTDQPSA